MRGIGFAFEVDVDVTEPVNRRSAQDLLEIRLQLSERSEFCSHQQS